jgi:hypothetical protein
MLIAFFCYFTFLQIIIRLLDTFLNVEDESIVYVFERNVDIKVM